MAKVLTSWKDIAAYLGKGVRTVQRWEEELGLPVRRPLAGKKNVVLAVADEIDDWVERQTDQKTSTAELELRAMITSLQAENEALRQRLSEVGNSQSRDQGCAPSSGTSLRVLVVDDNEVQGYIVARMLEQARFSVIRTDTGMGAIAAVSEQRPDLMLIDINLPDVNGFTVAETLKAHPTTRDLPVIFYSAEFASYHDWTARGCDAFLTMPMEYDHLLNTVRGSLARATAGDGGYQRRVA